MIETLTNARRQNLFSKLEIACIVLLASVPLFMSFPYRVNIFLSWEGAYRMSQGHIPYKDFGMPLGYMYWVIPAIFFKIFGAQLITLVKAQVLINILSGLAFRSILKSLDVQPGIRLLSVILYCISFSFFNFWPWYNHTVIVYEMIGLAFLMRYIFSDQRSWLLLSASALFMFFSFFTKQDGGGLALLLSIALLLHLCFYERQWKPLVIFLGSYLVIVFAIVAPLLKYNFSYWFNHGQPPHTARFSFFDVLDEFFYNSQWIKFYLLLILLIVLAYYKNWKGFLLNKKSSFFLLLTLGILAEAAILQVTSYTPPDNNIFFHSFAFAFIISHLSQLLNLNFFRTRTLLLASFGLLLWWSGTFWKYFQRLVQRSAPVAEATSATGENVVNRKTYMLSTGPQEIPMSQWGFSNLRSFEKIYMPKPTIEGINRLMKMYATSRTDAPDHNVSPPWKILNMTELTPLAEELPYTLERGPEVPLWYHLGVGMFNKEAAEYEKRIAIKYYDVVLFEYIPSLNNFYPFRTRDRLKENYVLIDSFPAPRRGETQGLIEVYKK
jgi:hypothetical protein